MTRTVEQKEYTRGYSRGVKRHYDRVRQALDIARFYKARLTDIDTARVCETCDRWTRGAGGNNSSGCKWGSCRADFEWGVDERMWVDLPLGTPRNLQTKITTSEKFGCVSWIPKSK